MPKVFDLMDEGVSATPVHGLEIARCIAFLIAALKFREKDPARRKNAAGLRDHSRQIEDVIDRVAINSVHRALWENEPVEIALEHVGVVYPGVQIDADRKVAKGKKGPYLGAEPCCEA